MTSRFLKKIKFNKLQKIPKKKKYKEKKSADFDRQAKNSAVSRPIFYRQINRQLKKSADYRQIFSRPILTFARFFSIFDRPIFARFKIGRLIGRLSAENRAIIGRFSADFLPDNRPNNLHDR